MTDQATNWTLDKLLSEWVSESLPKVTVKGLNLDSRLVSHGDLYLALAGSTTHGIHYAKSAVSAGAVAIAIDTNVCDQFTTEWQMLLELSVPIVTIDQLDTHAADIASRFYEYPDRAMTLIAVTGTDGKTSVCRFVAQALTALALPCGYIGTLGWGLNEKLLSTQLTTPDAVTLRRMLAALRDQGAEYVALEASSHGLAEGRLEGLKLDFAVLTNFGRDHLDYHGSIEGYKAAKLLLFNWETVSTWVINADDALGQHLFTSVSNDKVRKLAFGKKYKLSQESNDESSSATLKSLQVLASNISLHVDGLGFDVVEPDDRGYVRTHLLGEFNVDNLLACYCCLRACNIAANDARYAIEQVKPISGRMERISGVDGPIAVVDYCHTPQALALAINALRIHCPGELWVIFGCGGDRDQGKRQPMAKAAETADRIVVTDDNPRHEDSGSIIEEIMKGFSRPDQVSVIPDRVSAIRYAVKNANNADWILVAGKGHETYQIVGDVRYELSDRDEVKAALGLAS